MSTVRQPLHRTAPTSAVRNGRTPQSLMQQAADQSPQTVGLEALQQMADASTRASHIGKLPRAQRHATARPNQTGLPDDLKDGIEDLSGMSMDHVRVHRNSDKPAAVQAHAYAQGSEIHLAPGQERHLPHEAWHVVQQAQGRVQPTTQLAGVNVNNDAGLEHEADVMGTKALQAVSYSGKLRSGAAMQRAQDSRASVQYPALIGVPNQPVQSPVPGVVVTQLARADYDTWKNSAQAANTMHGAHHQGGQTYLARMASPAGVMQQFSFPLTPKMKAGLVMAEGALTFIAGIVGITAVAGTGAANLIVPAVAAVAVGVSKFIRGCLMWGEKAPEGKKLVVIDALRTLEAAVAIVGATFVDPSSLFKIPAMLFGVAKAVRALSMALADYWEANSKHPILVKGLRGLAAFAHVVEVATVGFSSVGGLVAGAVAMADGAEFAKGGAKVIGGAMGFATGVSKAVRAADQTHGFLHGKPKKPDEVEADQERRGSASSFASDAATIGSDRDRDESFSSIASDAATIGSDRGRGASFSSIASDAATIGSDRDRSDSFSSIASDAATVGSDRDRGDSVVSIASDAATIGSVRGRSDSFSSTASESDTADFDSTQAEASEQIPQLDELEELRAATL